jgi:hypothetical protein
MFPQRLQMFLERCQMFPERCQMFPGVELMAACPSIVQTKSSWECSLNAEGGFMNAAECSLNVAKCSLNAAECSHGTTALT